MNAQGYEILSLAARYWFIALGAAILALSSLAVYRSVRRDMSHAGEERPILTLILISDAAHKLKKGYSVPVYNEGMVGSGRTCDTRIRHKGIHKRHVTFQISADGVKVLPVNGAPVAIGGEAVAKNAEAHFGQNIQIGSLIFIMTEGGGLDEAE